jgi:hypothetical protein
MPAFWVSIQAGNGLLWEARAAGRESIAAAKEGFCREIQPK